MNRIILIGNGFDLAHGLPTAYIDFIKNYRMTKYFRLINSEELEEADELCRCIAPNKECRRLLNGLRLIANSPYPNSPMDSYIYGPRFAEALSQLSYQYESKFFEDINKAADTYDWVDIEATYYKWLKHIFKQQNCPYSSPVDLNDELDVVRARLIEYLQFVQYQFIKPEIVNDNLKHIMFEPFCIDDISNEGWRAFEKAMSDRLLNKDIRSLLDKYGYSDSEIRDIQTEIDVYCHQFKCVTHGDISVVIPDKGPDVGQHINNITNRCNIPDYYLLPEDIMLLNFNYTNTADLYISNSASFSVNHIHGELNNENNPVIFGYGDELDDDYREIAKLNDNDYLRNIKSIRYLETDNYRKLLKFINSAPFQIYVMGHSCGNSDRTLLNTLFEHPNCVSIKPFYHLLCDKSDNYIEIVQNISRNFNDMQKMRDRVVNKTYCKPLIIQ